MTRDYMRTPRLVGRLEHVVPEEPDLELERLLGSWFESWIPSTRQLVIRPYADGPVMTLNAGETLRIDVEVLPPL